MDDLLEGFSASLEVSEEPDANHRLGDYKKKSEKMDNQNFRRKKRLEDLKQRRFDAVNHIRLLNKSSEKDEIDDEESKTDSPHCLDEMEIDFQRDGHSHKLMLSEWLDEVPEDFNENWLMQVCPKGRRNLVVFTGRRVNVYTKLGKRVKTFYSAPPSNDSNTKHSVLDCIFSATDSCYYVLDTMAWNDHFFYDADCEFRFYFKNAKLGEHPALGVPSRHNPYPFKSLADCKCNRKAIEAELAKWDMDKVDGLLFYHKKTAYTLGTTPLVTWLKPSMLDEKLGNIL